MRDLVPAGWASALAPALEAPAFAELTRFVEAERATSTVLPAHEHVFAALAATPLEAVRVVLVGQDPYPTPGHAHGLALSVLPGVAPPRRWPTCSRSCTPTSASACPTTAT